MEKLVGTTVGDYTLLEVIGKGSFATVFKASSKQSNVAVKIFHKPSLSTLSLANIEREVEIMKMLNNEHICKFYEKIENPTYIFLVCELCEMDLFDAIMEKQGFPDSVAHEVFSQLIDVVKYCHDNGVYHRDLKPENILISKDFRIKLTDFGLATFDKTSIENGCGSARYMGPECNQPLRSPPIPFDCAKNDVWSLGIILFNLLFVRNPWHEAIVSDRFFSAFLVDSKSISKDFKITNDLQKIFERIFCGKEEERCGIEELIFLVEDCRSFTKDCQKDVEELENLEVRNYPLTPTSESFFPLDGEDAFFSAKHAVEFSSEVRRKLQF